MRITVDTNVLVRALVEDDAAQSQRAQTALAGADVVAITVPTLCELVWVLSRAYRIGSNDIADVIRRLINGANVKVDRSSANAGLAHLDAGGDFADGVIAHEGDRLGGDVFVSFDRRATNLIEAAGGSARLL